ncbi:31130_t:CDS:2 [Gigaspora margarita]|uniref:31130_t:CDS:1 n=1 Tax=Gigaspora margarita TaxID=4874 RepID=A0ABM8W6T1_GIGMA|nr:31130_t:CDS:2 [Gigaspora margarita]
MDIVTLNRKLEKLLVTYPIIPSDQMLLKDKVLNFDGMIEDNPIFDFVSLEKGIELHAKRDHKPRQCWQGYYLYFGYNVVEIDKKQAKQFFKEAADNDSADNKNVDAMYYLGKIYVNGNLGVEKNKEFGLEYLKLAAKENHEKAIKLLKNLGFDRDGKK